MMTPINVEQATLFNFLPDDQINPLITDEKRLEADGFNKLYTLVLERGNVLEVKETHCLACGKRLVKNGYNPRTVVLDMGRGRRELRVHRKRCKRCGEVRPDYSQLAPKYGTYHENYKRRARQHHAEGLTPRQIKNAFRIDFGIDVSESSVARWINVVAEPLRKMLKETPVPSSGYWGYDEIHMRIGGKKKYTITTVDMNTGFVPAALIKPRMGKVAGREVLKEGKRGKSLKLLGLVKDCTTNLGGLFRTRSFKEVELQNCLTHVKWIISKHVKAFAGLSTASRKPVPEQWRWLVKRFYRIVDAKTETESLIWLEIARSTIERLKGKKIKHLHVALRQLEGWFPKLIAHQRSLGLPATNNSTEGYHKKYERYPSFKRHMMTEAGAQRVLDYLVFGHNLKLFPSYIRQYERKYETWRRLIRKDSNDKILTGQGNHFKSMFKKLDLYFGKYQELWKEFFEIVKK